MKRVLTGVAITALCCVGLPGQAPPKSPAFEAADVHLRPADPFMSARAESYMSGGLLPVGRYELHRANLSNLIQSAYGVQDYEIFGGPNWIETEHYEVIAKTPPGTTPADLQLMLQAVLADRFKLVVHHAEEPMDVNVVTVVKEGLLKEGTGEPGCRGEGGNANGPPTYITVTCHATTMADFSRMVRGLLGARPVVDLTGLTGTYDFTFKVSPPGMMPPPGSDAAAAPRITFADAAEKQLGLKIAERKHPMPVLVIDSVNRTPTPNAPGIEKILGVPTEFEAASVKPSKPGDPIHKFQITRGRVEVENIPLRTLIAMSRNLFPIVGIQQNVGTEAVATFERDMIVGGPKWIETQGFDIVAKADDAAPYSPSWVPDHVGVMLRALLAERFKLVTHTEQRPVPVWVLVVGRGGPKLTPADPSSRSGCKWSGGQLGTGPAALPADVQTCHNVTMAQLAESLHAMDRGYVDRVAIDLTGLKGGYDFTLSWAKPAVMAGIAARRAQSQTAGAGGGPVPEAFDSAGITLFEALEKFGLKLESGRKAPQPVIVIDHVEPLAADN